VLAADRQRAILDKIIREASVRVAELALEYGVSGETIRRDLEVLERSGLVRRVHGGAVGVQSYPVRQYQEREAHRVAEKHAIGQLAATLVDDGDTILVDVGTTVLTFCKYLQGKKGLTVITPSMQAARLLKQTTDARVIVTGGELQDDEPYLTGCIAEQTIRQFHVQRAFISAGGIDLNVGITDFSDAEVQVRKTMMRCAEQVVMLADSSKFGVRAFSVIGTVSDIDVLVTDAGIHTVIESAIRNLGVEVMKAHTAMETKEAL
jgi:DeoR/GlpR family transcriptional regulator of sugar metabolism